MPNPSIDTADLQVAAESASFLFAGGGEMGRRMRMLDWSQTPLGPAETWPQSLKTTVSICLASRFPIVLYWGPEYVVLYNDAYREILGSKHPWALGQTCRVCWAEIWDTIGPMLDGVLKTGEAAWSNDLLLMLRRFGYPEECYFSFSFSPVRVESGATGGVFTAVMETTENVIEERRLQTLRDLAARASAAKSKRQVWEAAAATLSENGWDVPFAVLCESTAEGLQVAGVAGIEAAHPLCSALCRPGSGLFEEAMQRMKAGEPVEVELPGPSAGTLPGGAWQIPSRSAMLLPIPALRQGSPGLLLAAVSPAKRVDEKYRTFLDLLARQIATNVADARSYEQERNRAEALGDQSKKDGAPFLPALAALPTSAPPLQQGTVLVVEDNADMRQYLVHLLSAAYKVHAVADGISAVEAALHLRPALILTDVMMSGLDGFGVLRAIRAEPAIAGTPVLLLSARAGEESRVEGLEAGADDYLAKPFTARELLTRVGTHLRLAKVRREAAEMEARLRAQAEMERSRLRQILAQAPAAMALLSGPQHRFTYVNDLYLKLTGRYSALDLTGKTLREALPELEGQPYPDLLDRVYRTGEPYIAVDDKVQLVRMPGGSLQDVYVDSIYLPMRGASGNVEDILVHCLEVTDKVVARKQLEESLERLKSANIAAQRLAAIVESSDDAIVSKDLKGLVTSWNPCAERMFGYTAEEMIGRPITKIIPQELQADEDRILATITRGERIQHFETVRVAKNGERVEVSLSISPMRDETGQIIGASKIARDITQRKKTERALRNTERLASVGRLAATIAHEINNPLEAVTNLVYLAKANCQDDVIRDQLEQAEEELSRVALLTRQTLGFYRETRGVGKLKLASLVTPLAFAFQARARNKGVAVRTEFRQDPEITGIPGEIRQLIANLLSNGIDAALPGTSIRIRVSAARYICGELRDGVRLTVANAGHGIPDSLRARLFEAFFTTKKEIGTGLGLWVCKSVVERHGGGIRLKSCTTTGKSGAVFSVVLPAQPPTDLEESDHEQAPTLAQKIPAM